MGCSRRRARPSVHAWRSATLVINCRSSQIAKRRRGVIGARDAARRRSQRPERAASHLASRPVTPSAVPPQSCSTRPIDRDPVGCPNYPARWWVQIKIALPRDDYLAYGERRAGPRPGPLQRLLITRHMLVLGLSLTNGDTFLRTVPCVRNAVPRKRPRAVRIGTAILLDENVLRREHEDVDIELLAMHRPCGGAGAAARRRTAHLHRLAGAAEQAPQRPAVEREVAALHPSVGTEYGCGATNASPSSKREIRNIRTAESVSSSR